MHWWGENCAQNFSERGIIKAVNNERVTIHCKDLIITSELRFCYNSAEAFFLAKDQGAKLRKKEYFYEKFVLLLNEQHRSNTKTTRGTNCCVSLIYGENLAAVVFLIFI